MARDGRGRPRLDHLLVAAIFAVMAIVALVNVLGRYLFHYSLAFTEELTVNLFVWLTVLGIGLAFEHRAHLGMVSLLNWLPTRWQSRLAVVHAVLATAVFAVVCLTLCRTIYYEITLFRARSPALRLPVWLYYAGVVVFAPFVFRGIWRSVRTPRSPEQGE